MQRLTGQGTDRVQTDQSQQLQSWTAVSTWVGPVSIGVEDKLKIRLSGAAW